MLYEYFVYGVLEYYYYPFLRLPIIITGDIVMGFNCTSHTQQSVNN